MYRTRVEKHQESEFVSYIDISDHLAQYGLKVIQITTFESEDSIEPCMQKSQSIFLDELRAKNTYELVRLATFVTKNGFYL